MSKETKRYIIIGIVTIFAIPLIVLLVPFIIFTIIRDYVNQNRFEKEFKFFLSKMEGKKFLCYNNRKNNHHYVEKYVLPNLSGNIDLIFLERNTFKSKYEEKFISHLVNSVNDRNGFPYVIKIYNQKILDKSIHKMFHNFKSQNREAKELIDLINNF